MFSIKVLDIAGYLPVPCVPMADEGTQVWLRNPTNYIREAVEAGALNLIFDLGLLRKRRVDPYRFCDLHYGATHDWQAMLVGEQGAALIARGYNVTDPLAVYPTWEYGDDFDKLEDLCANPVGANPKLCSDPNLRYDERPVFGQEHRIVILRPPKVSTSVGGQFFRTLAELQHDYDGATLHLHGLYSYRVMFGMNFKSVDVDSRTHAQKGKVILPTGKVLTYEQAREDIHWINVLGMKPQELKIPRNRCIFNIKSAMWAGRHYKEELKITVKGEDKSDPDSPFTIPSVNKSIVFKRNKPQTGDKFLCDTCSLKVACKYYRDGAVCVVPDSEPQSLARYFKTRDADTIIDGLGTLLATQSKRLEDAMQMEDTNGEIHPEVTKIINTLFDRGVKLAKLLDPALQGGPKFTFNQQNINASSPQALMAAVVNELTSQGIARDKITPAMIEKILGDPDELKAKAIDVAAIDEKAS